jgi:hypothetical protein
VSIGYRLRLFIVMLFAGGLSLRPSPLWLWRWTFDDQWCDCEQEGMSAREAYTEVERDYHSQSTT